MVEHFDGNNVSKTSNLVLFSTLLLISIGDYSTSFECMKDPDWVAVYCMFDKTPRRVEDSINFTSYYIKRDISAKVTTVNFVIDLVGSENNSSLQFPPLNETVASMVDHGRPRSTMADHGRPWSTMFDHGRSLSTMVDDGRP